MEERKMRRRSVLTISLFSIFLFSSVLLGTFAWTRLSALNVYAKQVVVDAEGTSLELILYGDPEQSRQVFNLFEFFTTENLQWRGTSTDPQGNEVNIGLNLTSVEFSKVDADNYALLVEDVAFHINAGGLAEATIKADNVEGDIEFCTFQGLPACNITVVLTNNVDLSISLSVLPLPGLMQAVYEYKGDLYVIHICVLKPIEVDIDSPSEGDDVGGEVPIQASVKVAPGLKIEKAFWFADSHDGEGHFEGQMEYDPNTGSAQGQWPSYKGGDGGYKLGVRTEGVQEGSQGGMWFSGEEAIGVNVDNGIIPVIARYWEEDNLIDFNIQIEWWYQDKHETQVTPLEFDRLLRAVLVAPGEWEVSEGKVHFMKWVIVEGDTKIWEHGDTKIELHEDVLEKLYDGNKQLICVYEKEW